MWIQKRRQELLKRALLSLAVINGILGFSGGIVRLGTLYFPVIPSFPTIFMTSHRVLVVIGFFTTFIFLERWAGLQVMPPQLKKLSSFMAFFSMIGAFFLLFSQLITVIGGNVVLQESTFLTSITFYILSGISMLILQARIILEMPQFKTESSFIMMGFFLLLTGLASIVAMELTINTTLTRQFFYLACYLIVIILGERIAFSRIGRFGKKQRTWLKDEYFIIIGIIFTTGSILDMLMGKLILFQFNLGMLLILTLLIFLDDVGLEKTSTGTDFHSFQRIALIGGYSWQLLGLLLLTWHSFTPSLLLYDAGLHALTLGFIATMLLAHAPIVLPTIFNKPSITKLPRALTLLVLFWVLTSLRVMGNAFLFLFNQVQLAFIVAISGYLSIIPVLAYVGIILHKMREKSVTRKSFIQLN